MSTDELFGLLPAVYRSRDEEHGDPLRALLGVVQEQVDQVAGDLDRWYANWFVETCDEAVLGQLGALVGIGPDASRRDVADAVDNRRRKGTAAGLEAVAMDAAGWPARAVEAFPRLIRDQHVRHARLHRPACLDLRDAVACDRLGGPFDDTPHRVDMRRITSDLTTGRYNIPSLALFLWRLNSFPVTEAPAFCIDQRYNRYLVNVLGIDTQLFSPQPQGPSPAHLSGPADVPHPISRIEFEAALADHYGPGLSLMIWRDLDRRPVRREHVVVADLSDWSYRPTGRRVAVDPVLGRIAFSGDDAPEDGVWVSWHYGFSDRIGGGEYRRPLSPVAGRRRYVVGGPDGFASITPAQAPRAPDKAAAREQDGPTPHDALIEIVDSADYTEALRIDLGRDDRLELRAADHCRPVIRLLNQAANRFDALMIRATDREPPPGTVADCPPPSARRPRVVLSGLVVTGRSVDVVGQVGRVTVRHCTLVPGWTLDHDCRPRYGDEPGIELRRTTADLVVEHSITGTVVVDQDEVATEPLRIDIRDSIIDSTAPERPAISGPDDRYAYAVLTMRRCTVFGDVLVHETPLTEDCLLTGCLHPARPARSCVRYSAVAPDGGYPPDARPVFTSTRYGRPGYGQLADGCPAAIRTGAEDGSELGAFHDLQQPRRMAALAARLAEYVPIDTDVAAIPVT